MAGNETVRPAQVRVLQETVYAGRAESASPAALRESGLSPSTEGGVGPAVAGRAENREYWSGPESAARVRAWQKAQPIANGRALVGPNH